jgi:hypothetical protein
MTLVQSLRYNEIKRLTDCIVTQVTENAFSAWIPEANDPVAVGGDDCI